MSDVAIRVEGLGKQYHLGAKQERYHTFADQIRKWTSIRKLFRRGKRAESRPPFWALKDVSFEVKRGEVVGIIGRNGAGKSTLLKILSRITEPTEGGADIHGRVGSLLEVGTGFHPELTGRENVYLNGAILGMKRSEIVRKFDEIVAFAEVEKFIDTPVKHYSSGMYMRLAFAVAAHLDPEILVVDEVLAVGDAQFQKKCLGKMGEVAKGGRTVLLVSHQMQAVQAITQQAILLDGGQVIEMGPTSKVVRSYSCFSKSEQDLSRFSTHGSYFGRFHHLSLKTDTQSAPEVLVQGEVLQAVVNFEICQVVQDGNFAIAVRNGEGIEVFSDSWGESHDSLLQLEPGMHGIQISIPTQSLRPGPYWLTLCVTRHVSSVVAILPGIEIPPVISDPRSRVVNVEAHKWGIVHIRCGWSINDNSAFLKQDTK